MRVDLDVDFAPRLEAIPVIGGTTLDEAVANGVCEISRPILQLGRRTWIGQIGLDHHGHHVLKESAGPLHHATAQGEPATHHDTPATMCTQQRERVANPYEHHDREGHADEPDGEPGGTPGLEEEVDGVREGPAENDAEHGQSSPETH